MNPSDELPDSFLRCWMCMEHTPRYNPVMWVLDEYEITVLGSIDPERIPRHHSEGLLIRVEGGGKEHTSQ